jgi:hypothetical protein
MKNDLNRPLNNVIIAAIPTESTSAGRLKVFWVVCTLPTTQAGD